MTENSEPRSEDEDPDVDEFTAAQEGDYEPGFDDDEVLADEDERPIDDEFDALADVVARELDLDAVGEMVGLPITVAR